MWILSAYMVFALSYVSIGAGIFFLMLPSFRRTIFDFTGDVNHQRILLIACCLRSMVEWLPLLALSALDLIESIKRDRLRREHTPL